MRHLDVPTLLVVLQVLGALIFAFTLAGAWRSRHPEALWLWAGSFAVLWLAQVPRESMAELWGYRASQPVGHISGVVNAALLLLGIRVFLRRRLRWRLLLAVTVLAAIGSIGAIVLGMNAAWSQVITQLASGLLLGASVVDTGRAYRHSRHWPMLLMAMVMGVSALAAVARGMSELPLSGTVEARAAMSALWLLVKLALLVAQGFAILLLVNGALERELRTLADFDPLTGQLNRRGLEARVARLLQRNRGTRLALAMIDLDHFRAINDRHGHCVGDEVLVEVGRRLQVQSRPGDLVARFGGEEFVLVAVDAAPDMLARVAERFRAAVADVPFVTQSGLLMATISLGMSPRREHESLDELIARADESLYRAKREGRDRAVVVD